MGFRPEPIKKVTLSEAIVKRLKHLIKEEELKPGDKLPNEKELASMFGVGRSSIREALSVLTSAGILERNREGTFVKGDLVTNNIDLMFQDLALDFEEYAEIYEARKQIETTIVGLAATKADAEDISTLREILGEMLKPDLTVDEFAGIDADFHLNIALASKNRVLYRFLTTISDLLEFQVKQKFYIHGKELNLWEKSIREHQEILKAIEAKEADKCQELMFKHLDDAEQLFLRLMNKA